MITGELKSKIDSLWEIFWTGGLTNPLDVIEQMTYLMFIHDLDDSDNLRAKEAAMLSLPYKSIFAGEVLVGERTVDGSQLKWKKPAWRQRKRVLQIYGGCYFQNPYAFDAGQNSHCHGQHL